MRKASTSCSCESCRRSLSRAIRLTIPWARTYAFRDAGDHHDGPGLVSSTLEGAIKADEIFSRVPYDIMTIGNHEMYQYDSALEIFRNKAKW